VSINSNLPLGFRWSATTAGIKSSGKPDVALAHCAGSASAAAMFTRNQVVAAPITIGRAHLNATGGRVTAVIVNAGNANCATGFAGIEAARKTCVEVAEAFECVFDEVLPSSTGIIGVPFPTEKMLAAIPAAIASLGDTPAHAEAFATAILTTDTKLKTAHAAIEVEGQPVRIWACCKGAGMIGPQLSLNPPAPPHATMLVYLFTDLDATPAELRDLLAPAVTNSFNAISIDGDTSTNDTVLLLASGQSGVKAKAADSVFAEALLQVCTELAFAIVDDGEGVTHVVTLDITGARSDADAALVARAIAHSPLCKTAWSSGDPNWGRLLAAAGYSGASFNPDQVTITIAGLPVFEYGMRAAVFDEAATHTAMGARFYTIAIDLGVVEEGGEPATGRCRFLTCDLTHEYVSINADYST
jgi:glutamate N-acetyltransferase/amino-acid N-acetyltransferase